jgi:hypothetical protein
MIDFFSSLFLSESTKIDLNGTRTDIRDLWAVFAPWYYRGCVGRRAEYSGRTDGPTDGLSLIRLFALHEFISFFFSFLSCPIFTFNLTLR